MAHPEPGPAIRRLAVEVQALHVELDPRTTPQRVLNNLADAHDLIVGALRHLNAHAVHEEYVGTHRTDEVGSRHLADYREDAVAVHGEHYRGRHAGPVEARHNLRARLDEVGP